MSYYKSLNPDWIGSPVGIAKRPFIAGALREWPVRKYDLGPTTNYRMPGISGFGENEGAAGEFWAGQWAGGVGAGIAAGVAAGALQASNAQYDEGHLLSQGDEYDVQDSGGGDGTPEDASYDAYSTDVTGTGSGKTVPTPSLVPAPTTPEPVKAGGSLLVPIVLGLGLLGLVLWSRPKKKVRRNVAPPNQPRFLRSKRDYKRRPLREWRRTAAYRRIVRSWRKRRES